MSAEKPNFLTQPEVKSIYFYRNGDPYYEPRRLVLNAKRVSTFDTLLREVTGGVRAPFGAVRNIYTPTGGHKIQSLDHLRSGEQYVAAGRERFKKIDYLQIGTRKKRTFQPNGLVKPMPQNRIIVSARFLKPIKEPCTIFVVANGDVLNPAVRFLIPSRVINQFEHILEMITEKIGIRIVGGVRSLYTFDGSLITDGKELENGQFYVAVGRDKFKRLPYSDLLFNKPIAMKRVIGSKAASLPPIYKYRRQNGDTGHHLSKSVVGSSDGAQKTSPTTQSSKEHLSSIVREISQARLMTVRKKRSELTASLGTQDDDDEEDRSAEDDKSSPEEDSALEQEAEEASPDPDEEDGTLEQTDKDDSKPETAEEPTDSEPVKPDETSEEPPCNEEEEEKQEDESTEEDGKNKMEEENVKEEIKEEGETEPDGREMNGETEEEETEATQPDEEEVENTDTLTEEKEQQNEEETVNECDEKQVEGEEEKTENEEEQTEERDENVHEEDQSDDRRSPDQSADVTENTEELQEN